MGNDVSSRRVFESIDRDNDGDINLKDLLNIEGSSIPGLEGFESSPLLLFQVSGDFYTFVVTFDHPCSYFV